MQGIERIAMGRCEHVSVCSKRQPDEIRARRPECLGETKRELRASMPADSCSSGMDRQHMDDCLIAIRAMDCSLQLPRVQSIAECRMDYLCP